MLLFSISYWYLALIVMKLKNYCQMNNNRIYSARKNPLPLKYSTKIFNRNLKKQYFLTCIFSSLFLPYKIISLKQTYLHVVILKSTFKHEKFNYGLKYGSIFLECLYYFVNYIIFSIFYIYIFFTIR